MPKKTYKIGEDIYDIEDSDVAAFLKQAPNAKEVKSFLVGKDTFDLELPDVDAFIKQVPDAKPLYEESLKKKDFQDFNQKYGTSYTREQFIGQEPISPPTSSTVSPSASKPPKSITPSVSTGVKTKVENLSDFNKKYNTNYTPAQMQGKQPVEIQPEDESFASELFQSAQRGSAMLGSMLANTPSFIYNVAAYPQNKIAELTGLPIGTSSAQIAETLGLPENEIANYYEQVVKDGQAKVQQKYDKSVTEYLFGDNPDYKKGFKLLSNQVVESAPISLSMMMGNAAGIGAVGSTLGGGLVFGAGNMQDLEGANMSETAKVENALSKGLFEGIFEQFGVTKLGGVVSDVFKKQGAEAAANIAKEGFKDVYLPALKKYVGIGAEESLGEAATQFSQNMVTILSGENPNLNPMEGVADAALVGLGSSVAYSTPTAAAETLALSKKRKEIKEQQSKLQKIEEAVANPETTPETKAVLSNMANDINGSIADAYDESKNLYQNLSEEDRVELSQILTKKQELEIAAQDPNIDEEIKKEIGLQIEGIDDKINEISDRSAVESKPEEIKTDESGISQEAAPKGDTGLEVTEPTIQEGKEQVEVEETPTKEEITPEQIETGRQEVSAVKEGKVETANPIRLFKGLFGKRNLDGTHKSAHPNAKGVFSAVDEKVAERYKGEDGMGTFDIPAGTTMEVIRLAVRNVPMSKFREQETEAINASDAQIVKLITTDAKGAEEQYVIKDPALIEKMQKPEKGAKAEEAVSESKSSEPSKSDKNYQEAQEANSIVSKENPNASVLIQPKGEDLSLTAIYVGKEKRGKGIGSKVLESVKKQANKLGKKVVLDATNELDEETDLERLGNFYEKNGFKKVGENKYEYDPKAKDSSGDIINGTDIEGTKESDITAGTNKGESSENVSVPTKEEVVQVETNKQQEDAVQKQTAGQVPVQPEAKVGEGVEGGKPEAEPKEATEESKEVAKKAGISPKNLRDLYNVNRKLFDLDRVKSLASAVAMDRMIGAMAKRAGTTKTEMYGKLKFEKTSEKDLPQGVKMQVDAWHGSPYEFDKFSTEFMGKGEGAQAFGWGLYFTDLESIARSYANILSQNVKKQKTIFIDGKNLSELTEFRLRNLIDSDKIKSKERLLTELNKIKENTQKEYETLPNNLKEKITPFLEAITNDIKLVEKSKEIEVKEPSRNLYKVSLQKGKTPDQYTWLEWDKPMTDSNIERVLQQFLKDNLPKEFTAPSNHGNTGYEKGVSYKAYRPDPAAFGLNEGDRFSPPTAGKFYKKLSKYFEDSLVKNPEKEASLLLLRAGIDGIKYPAESISRGATSETARAFNYVVFDENAVSIEEVIKFQKDANKARGAVMVTLDGEAVIYALTDPNVSTPLHELAHVFEHYLTDAEKNAVMKAAGTKEWNIQTSEFFARGFEKYLAEGKSPVPALDKLFAKFKEWLTEIYNGIKGSDIDIKLNKKMRDIYSQMLGVEIEEGKPKKEQVDGVKVENSKKAFEALLKEESASPTAKKKASELKKEAGDKAVKEAAEIMENIDSIRQQLLDAGVIKSINCKWG